MGHSGRFELKYIIEEERAVAIADYVSSYLKPSENNSASPLRGHRVVSLYMDSPDHFFYRQAYTGHKNRMKLRIRFYHHEWEKPACLEIKRRVADVICKDRALISKEGVRQILSQGWPAAPFWPDPSGLFHGKRRVDINDDFWGFANQVRARGMIYVSYIREVWESKDDDELRVTFDRHIHGSAYDGSGRLHVPQRGWRPFMPPYMAPFPPDGVVLELKFDEFAPRWMFDMVRIFNLQRIPVCKYTACTYAQQLEWGGRVQLDEEEELML